MKALEAWGKHGVGKEGESWNPGWRPPAEAIPEWRRGRTGGSARLRA